MGPSTRPTACLSAIRRAARRRSRRLSSLPDAVRVEETEEEEEEIATATDDEDEQSSGFSRETIPTSAAIPHPSSLVVVVVVVGEHFFVPFLPTPSHGRSLHARCFFLRVVWCMDWKARSVGTAATAAVLPVSALSVAWSRTAVRRACGSLPSPPLLVRLLLVLVLLRFEEDITGGSTVSRVGPYISSRVEWSTRRWRVAGPPRSSSSPTRRRRPSCV